MSSAGCGREHVWLSNVQSQSLGFIIQIRHLPKIREDCIPRRPLKPSPPYCLYAFCAHYGDLIRSNSDNWMDTAVLVHPYVRFVMRGPGTIEIFYVEIVIS